MVNRIVSVDDNFQLPQVVLDAMPEFHHTHDLNSVADTDSRVAMLPTERVKLSGVSVNATANATDAQLRDRTTHTGTQSSTTISDLTEAVQDIVGAFIVGGSNVFVTYNDVANTLTINASGGGTAETDPEIVRDVIGSALVAGAGVQIIVDDTTDTIAIASTAVLPTRQITAGSGLSGGGDLSTNRTLSVKYGTTADTVAEGNDDRFSDQRTPIDGSVTEAKVAPANKDGAAATPSMRTLGVEPGQAKPGDWLPSADEIPNLPTSKIDSGVFDSARIPGVLIAGVLNPGQSPSDLPPGANGLTHPVEGGIYLVRDLAISLEGITHDTGATSDNQTSYSTGSVQVEPGSLVVAIFRAQSGTPAGMSAINGLGLTWIEVGSVTYRSDDSDRITAWYAIAPSGGSGVVTFSPDVVGTGASWLVRSYVGYNAASPVSSAIVASSNVDGNTTEVSFPGVADLPGDLTVWAGCANSSETGNTGTDATVITQQSHTSPSASFVVQEQEAQNDPRLTWSMSRNWGGIAFKIKAAV